MTLLVKICGLGDQRAVCAAVDAGADAVGFVFFEKSPRNITPEAAAIIAAEVPENILRVAVMLHPKKELWNEVSEALKPDVLQTDHGDFSYLDVADHIAWWPVLREGRVPHDGALPATFVYEGTRSGQGQTVNWSIAADIARRGRMILAGGLTIDNVADAINEVAPFGVDVSSAVETAPGKKDVAKIAAFVAAARAAYKRSEKGKRS